MEFRNEREIGELPSDIRRFNYELYVIEGDIIWQSETNFVETLPLLKILYHTVWNFKKAMFRVSVTEQENDETRCMDRLDLANTCPFISEH